MPEIIDIPISQGLRPEEDLLYDLQYQESAKNLFLNKNGVFEAERFVRTAFGLNVTAQVFVTKVDVYVITLQSGAVDDVLYQWDGATLTSKIGGIPSVTRGNVWSCADFGVYVLFTNGVTTLVRNITTGAFTIANATYPISNAICVHRGRLILASPVTTTFGITPPAEPQNLIAWSKINELTFQNITTTDMSNLSGYMPAEYLGEHLRVEPLKKHVIVYGENGITALTLAGTAGYASTVLHPLGIKDAGSICTNGTGDGITMHYFIDTSGELYTVNAGLTVSRIGYKELFSADHTSYPGLIRMSYNSRRDEVFINFYDSLVTYILGRYGLSTITANIEDCVEKSGTRYIHAPEAIDQGNIYYQSNIIDMDSDLQKHLWGFSARIASPDVVSVTIQYRTTRTGSWKESTAVDFDKASGYFNAGRLIGVEFRIIIEVNNTADYTTFKMGGIKVRYSKINAGFGG